MIYGLKPHIYIGDFFSFSESGGLMSSLQESRIISKFISSGSFLDGDYVLNIDYSGRASAVSVPEKGVIDACGMLGISHKTAYMKFIGKNSPSSKISFSPVIHNHFNTRESWWNDREVFYVPIPVFVTDSLRLKPLNISTGDTYATSLDLGFVDFFWKSMKRLYQEDIGVNVSLVSYFQNDNYYLNRVWEQNDFQVCPDFVYCLVKQIKGSNPGLSGGSRFDRHKTAVYYPTANDCPTLVSSVIMTDDEEFALMIDNIMRIGVNSIEEELIEASISLREFCKVLEGTSLLGRI